MVLTIILILALTATVQSSPFLSVFSSNDDEDALSSEITTPSMVLAPANATVSSNVSVTLGCQANVAVRVCQWSFIPLGGNRSDRVDLTPFSPSSREQRKSRSDKDCSLRIKVVEKRHSGTWTCAIRPMVSQKQVLVSKGALLRVVDFHPTTMRPVPTTTTTTTTTMTMTMTPSFEVPAAEPRLQLTPAPGVDSLDEIPYFIIDHQQDGSIDVTWILDRDVDLRECIWVTPGRNRLSSEKTLSGSFWLSRGNSSCGLRLPPLALADPAFQGTWTVRAEVSQGSPIISSSLTLSDAHLRQSRKHDEGKHKNATRARTTTNETEHATVASDLITQIASVPRPVIVVLIVLTVLLVISLTLLLLLSVQYYRQSRAWRRKLPASDSIVGIVQGMPVKSCLKTNPKYAKYEPPRVEEKSARTEQGPDSFVSSLTSSETPTNKLLNRNSVIGIESHLEQNDREVVHYSHILPRYDRAHDVPEPAVAYFEMLVPPKGPPKRRSIMDEQYEIVAKPMPPYENNLHVMDISSLRRECRRNQAGIAEANAECNSSSSDSGVC